MESFGLEAQPKLRISTVWGFCCLFGFVFSPFPARGAQGVRAGQGSLRWRRSGRFASPQRVSVPAAGECPCRSPAGCSQASSRVGRWGRALSGTSAGLDYRAWRLQRPPSCAWVGRRGEHVKGGAWDQDGAAGSSALPVLPGDAPTGLSTPPFSLGKGTLPKSAAEFSALVSVVSAYTRPDVIWGASWGKGRCREIFHVWVSEKSSLHPCCGLFPFVRSITDWEATDDADAGPAWQQTRGWDHPGARAVSCSSSMRCLSRCVLALMVLWEEACLSSRKMFYDLERYMNSGVSCLVRRNSPLWSASEQ